MPRYIVERELPGAGNLSQADVQGILQKSCGVLSEPGSQVEWIESVVTENKIYGIYAAPDKEMIKKHADPGGFPADRIEEIKNVIHPAAAEEKATV